MNAREIAEFLSDEQLITLAPAYQLPRTPCEWYVYAGMFHNGDERYTYRIPGDDGAYAQVVFEETQQFNFDFCGIGKREIEVSE